jgi:arginine deiminase
MYVDNEISKLEKVIVHFPDSGISRITPKQAEELLFDDIVFYPLMNKEYRIFLRLLKGFLKPENVFEVEQLLSESLDISDKEKKRLIKQIIQFEELPASFESYFKNLASKSLAQLLISGYVKDEDRILYDPIPNFMFTRDIAVTIKDHILITKAAKEARHRENLLSWFIFRNHPMFAELSSSDRLIDLNDLEYFPPSKKGESVSAEGGDIMMFDNDHLLIGCSERTSAYAFECIKAEIFQRKLVKHVVQVNIPNDRSFMHIDTLFTRIDHDLIACYKPIVYDGEGSNVNVYEDDGSMTTYASIKDYIQQCINPDMRFVFSGGGITPYQEREQWTDSCNLVAVRPGVAISYDRNLKTLASFEAAGYKVIDAEEVFQYHATDSDYLDNLENTIITIPSAELSRARGGSHCMTCPISRIK